MIRPAKLSDIMRILALAEEGHAKSIYRDKGNVDAQYARSFFARCINRHDHSNVGATYFLVSHEGADITGYFLGYLDRTYQIGDRLTASDIHVYMSDRGSPRDALAMVNGFIEWARGCEDVIEIIIGKMNTMGEDDGRFGDLLKRKGFEDFGRMFRLGIQRGAGAQAA